MVSPSRADNSYCHKLSKTISLDTLFKYDNLNDFLTWFYNYRIKDIDNDIPRDKYHNKRYDWVNIHSIFYRNTIEIRLHNGTLNSKKIIYWHMIHNRLLQWVVEHNIGDVVRLDYKQFLNEVLNKKLRNYVFNRIKEFEHKTFLNSLNSRYCYGDEYNIFALYSNFLKRVDEEIKGNIYPEYKRDRYSRLGELFQ
jgi:hypothetical protein